VPSSALERPRCATECYRIRGRRGHDATQEASRDLGWRAHPRVGGRGIDDGPRGARSHDQGADGRARDPCRPAPGTAAGQAVPPHAGLRSARGGTGCRGPRQASATKTPQETCWIQRVDFPYWPSTREAVTECQLLGLCRTSSFEEQFERCASINTRSIAVAFRRSQASLSAQCAPRQHAEHLSAWLKRHVAPYDSFSL